MIEAQLSGGLGNQMFQYACGRALSLRNDSYLVFDESILSQARMPRDYALSCFNIEPALVSYKNETLPVVKEKHYQFDKSILSLNYVRLEGYWQSEKYFSDFADAIRKDFTLRSPIGDEFINMYHAVSIHVRRKDYVTDKQTNQVHGLCSVEYYLEAVKYVKDRVKDPVFFIFTDEPEWITPENFPIPGIVMSGDLADYHEMSLMSQCNHNITANSSFSWWGAWLNQNPEKIVIAPKQWFRDATFNIKDLLPEKWIKM